MVVVIVIDEVDTFSCPTRHERKSQCLKSLNVPLQNAKSCLSALTASLAREASMRQPQIPPGGLQQQLDGPHPPIVPTPHIVTYVSTSWSGKGRSTHSLYSTVPPSCAVARTS